MTPIYIYLILSAITIILFILCTNKRFALGYYYYDISYGGRVLSFKCLKRFMNKDIEKLKNFVENNTHPRFYLVLIDKKYNNEVKFKENILTYLKDLK